MILVAVIPIGIIMLIIRLISIPLVPSPFALQLVVVFIFIHTTRLASLIIVAPGIHGPRLVVVRLGRYGLDAVGIVRPLSATYVKVPRAVTAATAARLECLASLTLEGPEVENSCRPKVGRSTKFRVRLGGDAGEQGRV